MSGSCCSKWRHGVKSNWLDGIGCNLLFLLLGQVFDVLLIICSVPICSWYFKSQFPFHQFHQFKKRVSNSRSSHSVPVFFLVRGGGLSSFRDQFKIEKHWKQKYNKFNSVWRNEFKISNGPLWYWATTFCPRCVRVDFKDQLYLFLYLTATSVWLPEY